jgi:hypothetical protein
VLSINAECKEAVAALARYAVLKAPDKAEYRALAVDCAMKLTADLPRLNRDSFVVFVARMSRSAKVIFKLQAPAMPFTFLFFC